MCGLHYRDPILDRIQFEAAYALANGTDTFTITYEREMDLVTIRSFIRHCNDPIITAALTDPEQYLSAEKAKLLGAHTGQKTSRAIRRYMLAKGMNSYSDQSMFAELGDAINPIPPVDITYRVTTYEENGRRYIKVTATTGETHGYYEWYSWGGWR